MIDRESVSVLQQDLALSCFGSATLSGGVAGRSKHQTTSPRTMVSFVDEEPQEPNDRRREAVKQLEIGGLGALRGRLAAILGEVRHTAGNISAFSGMKITGAVFTSA